MGRAKKIAGGGLSRRGIQGYEILGTTEDVVECVEMKPSRRKERVRESEASGSHIRERSLGGEIVSPMFKWGVSSIRSARALNTEKWSCPHKEESICS